MRVPNNALRVSTQHLVCPFCTTDLKAESLNATGFAVISRTDGDWWAHEGCVKVWNDTHAEGEHFEWPEPGQKL